MFFNLSFSQVLLILIIIILLYGDWSKYKQKFILFFKKFKKK